jgi:dTDP-4-amino-4,6-dideoxygalactose transaminase
MAFLRNFGHDVNDTYAAAGINGKNSEFHAAMGLVNLKQIKSLLQSRIDQTRHYDAALVALDVKKPQLIKGAETNYSYYPIIFKTEELLLKTMKELNDNWIYPRRYFYPSLSTLPFVKQYETPLSNDISKRVLCLPMYHTLTFEEIDFVSRILLRAQNS